ncbi:MAG: family 43 glycosylhydrolase [Prevotella sp.]|nr:family 43 glycosylhydrolase [Prevotella sp.]
MNYKLILLPLLLLSTPLSAQSHREYTPSPVEGTPWNAPGNMNPFIPGYFADPTIRKFGDTYYLYATTDGTGNGYGPAQVWVSKDFVNWKNIVMNWPTTEVVWAPDVVQQPDGKFRYYYCEPCNINIGESTSPIGPWKNILGKADAVMVPDRYIHNVITLDPQLFRDDDGSEYLYFTTWGIYKGFGCGVAKLNEKHTTAIPPSDARFWREDNPFPIAADSFFTDKRLIPNTELKDIFEAPFVFKRNGVYYFTYSSGSCHTDTYRVQYATSKTGPMGPFEYKGEILTTNEDQTVHGPGHHSVIEIGGKYYIVYHRHNNPKSVHGFNRQVCIDELKFDADGNIQRVVPTHNAQNVDFFTGASKYKNLAYGAKITASSYYDDWFKPEYAVDDNNATLWKARCVAQNDPLDEGMKQMLLLHPDDFGEWLQIDLGKPTKFNEVWTQFEYATFFYQYVILTSTDGQTWDLFADRSANTMQGSPMIDKKAVKARYVRIVITDTQKNGHMPAIWNVKIWQKAPTLPDTSVESNDGYPGMHKKDVDDRYNHQRSGHMAPPPTFLSLDARQIASEDSINKPTDFTEIRNCSSYSVEGSPDKGLLMKANTPLRLRVKDGHWAFFFNGSQHLTVPCALPNYMRYNAPYFIEALVLPTKNGPVSTVVSLSNSHADLATTQFRLGSDPAAGLLNHNGSFESCGAPKDIQENEGKWQHWFIAYDGWMEKVYLNGRLLREQNNFLMIRPEGNIVIGADSQGTNNFVGYIALLNVTSGMKLFNSNFRFISDEYVQKLYENRTKKTYPSLGDDDFEEIDPDSKFELPTTMKPVYEQKEEFTLSAQSAAFNDAPLQNGGHIYKEVSGDFVVMTRIADMEGLREHSVKAYNEGGLLVTDGQGTYYQLGTFPLYNCGNMLTILNPHGRPQFPNYKGYDPDPILQFERRGNKLYARTSRDGKNWTNMPGSPIEVKTEKMAIGAYQTTYNATTSWVRFSEYVIYQ